MLACLGSYFQSGPLFQFDGWVSKPFVPVFILTREFKNKQNLHSCIPAAISMKKDIGREVRENILKYAPLLRNPLYKLNKAADHLENWVNGVLDLQPLLDVRGCLGVHFINLLFDWIWRKRPMSLLYSCHLCLLFHTWPIFTLKVLWPPTQCSAQVCCGIPFSCGADLTRCACGRVVWGIREFVVEAWACTVRDWPI